MDVVLYYGAWTGENTFVVGFGGWESMVQLKTFYLPISDIDLVIPGELSVQGTSREGTVRVSLRLVTGYCMPFTIWIVLRWQKGLYCPNCGSASLLRLSLCIRLTGMILRALCIWKPELLLFIGKLKKKRLYVCLHICLSQHLKRIRTCVFP